eukprot:gb/GECG01006671.1/.p1 GENE.gb/GECG01006671.1/~~gb/GECG01006671.1/.p1  ORF type:complete len:345 (+),score=35.47 gb/GECG01006671.1/:1-1035(+)
MSVPSANDRGQHRFNPLESRAERVSSTRFQAEHPQGRHGQKSTKPSQNREDVTVNVLYATNNERANPAASTEMVHLGGSGAGPMSRTRRQEDDKRTDATEATSRPFGLPSTRYEIGKMLDSHAIQLCILVLLIVDVCAIVTETTVAHICHEELHSLFYLSVAILSLFLFQQIALMVCFDVEFFKKPLYVLDVVVVLVALVLELTIEDPEGGLLIVLMLWRAVRVVHGVAVSVETGHESNPHVKKEIEEIREQKMTMSGYTYIVARCQQMKQAARVIQQAYWKHSLRLKQKQLSVSGPSAVLEKQMASLRYRLKRCTRILVVQRCDILLEDDENIRMEHHKLLTY